MRLTVPADVVLVVGDLDRSPDFHTGVLGRRSDIAPGPPFAQLDTGATRVAL